MKKHINKHDLTTLIATTTRYKVSKAQQPLRTTRGAAKEVKVRKARHTVRKAVANKATKESRKEKAKGKENSMPLKVERPTPKENTIAEARLTPHTIRLKQDTSTNMADAYRAHIKVKVRANKDLPGKEKDIAEISHYA